MAPTAFIASMTKSGNTEADCRSFATDTKTDITSTIASTQATLDAVDTGSGCAAEGQTGVTSAQTALATAQATLVTAQADVVTAQAAKTTACTADVAIPTMGLNEMETLLGTCSLIQGFIQDDAVYTAVKAGCTTATATHTAAQAAVVAATSGVTNAQAALAAAVAEAARLMNGCQCRVSKEQAAAWTAAGLATAPHARDWKQAHEILCALDATTTCTVPTCPAVTQPTLAAGVSDASCTKEPTTSPTAAPTTPPTTIDVTFTNCGSTGVSGPSQSQCDAADGHGTVVTAGYQKFTVTQGGSYTIEAQGAAGGNHGGGLGGYGAVAKTTVTLTAGDVLLMVVGQKGGTNPNNADWGGAGGGGTFVARVATQGDLQRMTVGAFNGMYVEPLVVAGGGSGMDDRYNSGQAEGGRIGAGDFSTASTGGSSQGGGGWVHAGSGGAGSFLTGMRNRDNRGGYGGGGFGGGGGPYNGGGGGGGYDGGDCTIRGTDNGCYGGSSLNGITANSNTGDGSIHLAN